MAPRRHTKRKRIEAFFLEPGTIVGNKYEVVAFLGAGWESEVYKLRELGTNIERAGKFFFPQRNIRNRTARAYAKKLHKLRDVPILIQYHTQGTLELQGEKITFLISEFVDGELLSDFLRRQPGKRVSAFQGLHLIHALACGIEGIHNLREYHGDLHSENIIIRRHGISFDLKLVDLFHYGAATSADRQHDVCDLVGIFYEAIGGRKQYAKQPPEVKAICCGLKRSLILKKFRTAGQMRHYLETMHWT